MLDRVFQALTLCEMYVSKLHVIQLSVCCKKEWQLLYALEKDIVYVCYPRKRCVERLLCYYLQYRDGKIND